MPSAGSALPAVAGSPSAPYPGSGPPAAAAGHQGSSSPPGGCEPLGRHTGGQSQSVWWTAPGGGMCRGGARLTFTIKFFSCSELLLHSRVRWKISEFRKWFWFWWACRSSWRCTHTNTHTPCFPTLTINHQAPTRQLTRKAFKHVRVCVLLTLRFSISCCSCSKAKQEAAT